MTTPARRSFVAEGRFTPVQFSYLRDRRGTTGLSGPATWQSGGSSLFKSTLGGR